MKYTFHPEAELELENSIAYYEACQIGMGYNFALEIHSAINRIIYNPKAWTILENGIRRCMANRFPYGVIYSEHDNEIFILAVMNLRREPNYWKNRLK